MKEKKAKISKIREQRSVKERISSLAFAGIALILTVAVFFGLVFLEDALTNDIVYQQVIVAKSGIPEGSVITQDNAESLFTIKNVNTLDASTGYMTSVNDILNCKTRVPFCEGEIISAKDFEDLNAYTEGIENPVEISVDISNIADADGGAIRQGDLVNLTMMFSRDQLRMAESYQVVTPQKTSLTSTLEQAKNKSEKESLEDESETEEESSEEEISQAPAPTIISPISNQGSSSEYRFDYYSRYVAENLYVVRALDASGVEVAPSDKETPASILVFLIDKSDEAEFNNALANCANKRVSRVVKAQSNISAPQMTIEDADIEAETEETSTEE